MGRYSARRITWRERLRLWLREQALERGWLRIEDEDAEPTHRLRPVPGFLFAAGLILVSIVDPYSGSMASADTNMTFDRNTADPTQTYGYFGTQNISFQRGGYKVTTGGDGSGIFVPAADVPSPGTVKAIAFDMVTARQWGADQFSCLVALWTRESNWRVNAYNSGSGAYGIPQALPGAKMASAGPDWASNPATQITWGLNYIQGRYGSPCGAYAHSNKFGWY